MSTQYRDVCLDYDNLIKGETKPIIKLDSQLTHYIRMKKKTNLKIKLSNPRTKSTSQTCE
jgi:hypothetical protein